MVQVSEAGAAGGARGRDEDVAYLVRYLREERGLVQAPAEGLSLIHISEPTRP